MLKRGRGAASELRGNTHVMKQATTFSILSTIYELEHSGVAGWMKKELLLWKQGGSSSLSHDNRRKILKNNSRTKWLTLEE